jgi:hypothetical protein
VGVLLKWAEQLPHQNPKGEDLCNLTQSPHSGGQMFNRKVYRLNILPLFALLGIWSTVLACNGLATPKFEATKTQAKNQITLTETTNPTHTVFAITKPKLTPIPTTTPKPTPLPEISTTSTFTSIPSVEPIMTPTIYPLSVVTIINNMNNMNEPELAKFCNQIIGARVKWTLKIEQINRGSQWKYPNSFTLVLPGHEDEWLGIWLMNLSNNSLSQFQINDSITFAANIHSCILMEISLIDPEFK